jgi:molybdopterin-guanine dinucleotide biosynthesis protein
LYRNIALDFPIRYIEVHMEDTLPSAEQMILIGATGRNAGKTVLATELIRLFKDRFTVIGLKATTVTQGGAPCPRGGKGCGACGISTPYVLEEEGIPTNESRPAECAGKDTARLLQAGAERVFWLRSVRTSLAEGFTEFLQRIPPAALVIGESNSLREVVRPGCFIMVKTGQGEPIKPSAARVADLARITVESPITADSLKKITAALIIDRTAAGQPRVRSAG